MKKINCICIITNHYPTQSNPVYTFVDQLVCEFADIGIECIVISPQSLSSRILKGNENMPVESVRITKSGYKIKVIRPYYISFSKTLLNINTSLITYKLFKNAVFNEFKKRSLSPDIIYGHFIFPAGMCTSDIGKKLKIPSFLAYGESSTAMYKNIKKSYLQEKLSQLSGVISVSSYNKKELIDMKLVTDLSKIGIFPNAIDNSLFRKIDKKIAREKLGIDRDKFIIAFVGHFIDRKGVQILSNVLNQVEDVYSFFIGSGTIEPTCKNILYKGKVPHYKVPLYLNAADIFVLPTKAEGCCNAIIEAMACGLPVVSSDLAFNDDILDNNNSIRIDVTNEEALKKAILQIKNDISLLHRMSEAALNSASNLSISQRAKKIISFMESKL